MNEENIYRIHESEREIILVGTAHVSEESVRLVETVIREEKPDTVCIELCQARYETLTQQKTWQDTDLFKIIKEKKAFLLLANLILSAFQKRIGRKLGIQPGEEMRRAIVCAGEAGARIHLADRDIRTTLARVWRLMGFWSKMKLLSQMLVSFGEVDDIKEEDIERMKREDVLETLLSEMGTHLPEMRRILIDERDLYLTHRIRQAPGSKVVAVVGAGHVPGIKRAWKQTIDLDELEVVPPRSPLLGILKWGIPALVLLLIVLGFFYSGKSGGTDMIKTWVLANAGLSGLGAALALAHPLTILSAVIAAPFTSLNPLIAAGWVAGLVQIFLNKPKVSDFERLPEDIVTIKGFWSNKITRVLLIVVLTNVGSSVGTFVAIPLMARFMT